MVQPFSQTTSTKTSRNMVKKMINSGVITTNGIITHMRLAGKFMEGLLIGKRRVRVVHFKKLLIKSHNLLQMHFHSLRNS